MNYRSLEVLFWEEKKKESGLFSCAIKASASGKYGPSHHTVQHPLSKLSSNMEKKNQPNSKHCSIQDNDIHFFHLKTLLKTGILPMHKTLESVTYFEEAAPLYHEETLPTQR